MKQGIIFDMDGVLIDSEPVYMERTQNFLKEMGYGVISTEELSKLVGCDSVYFADKINQWTDGELTLREFNDGCYEFYLNKPIDFPKILDPNVPVIMSWLRERDIPIVVASSSSPDTIKTVLENCDLDKYVYHTVSGYDFPRSKPDPAIYLHSLEKIGLPSDQCIAVEDSAYGIEAARRAGIKVLAKHEPRFGVDQSAADGIINSLVELKEYFQ